MHNSDTRATLEPISVPYCYRGGYLARCGRTQTPRGIFYPTGWLAAPEPDFSYQASLILHFLVGTPLVFDTGYLNTFVRGRLGSIIYVLK